MSKLTVDWMIEKTKQEGQRVLRLGDGAAFRIWRRDNGMHYFEMLYVVTVTDEEDVVTPGNIAFPLNDTMMLQLAELLTRSVTGVKP